MFQFYQPFQGVVRHLVILNVLAFFASLILLGEANADSLGRLQFAAWPPDSGLFEPYQILTYMFMHSGIAHLAFNMLSLYMIGSLVEMVWGPKRFLFFYLFCGVGSLVLHFVMQWWLQAPPAPILGASGAIYGIFVAFAYLFPDQELQLIFPPVRLKAKYFVMILVGIDLFGGFGGYASRIAHFAHLGGALFGFIMIMIWYKGRKRV